MKITRKGLLPQMELGPRLGGAKVLFQRSGIVMRSVTMMSAMVSAWSTTPLVRDLFFNDFKIFTGVVVLSLCAWMAFDYTVLLPSQQTFNQGQAHRAERSPLKRDTETIINQLQERSVATDGGDEPNDDD